jgi:hypothetical protein
VISISRLQDALVGHGGKFAVEQQQAKHAMPSLASAAAQLSRVKWMRLSFLSLLKHAAWVTWLNTFALTQALQREQFNVLSKTTWPSVSSTQVMVVL